MNLIPITFIPSPLAKFIKQTHIKVRKRQHQYPDFGHTQGGIQKKPAKKYISIQPGWNSGNNRILMVSWISPSFFFPERLHCFYIDFHCFYLYTTIIPLEPCALNAEIQLLVLSFSISCWDLIKFPYFTYTTKRGVRGWKEGQRQGDFADFSISQKH